MNELFAQSDEPRDDALNKVPLADQPGADAGPSPAPRTAASTMDDIDREVAEAMASMDPADMAELCGDVGASEGRGLGEDAGTAHAGPDGENVAAGTALIGTVAGVSEDEVFLEFGAKSQGVMPRSQFGKKETIDVGRRVDVVVERYDSDAGLLMVSRKGAIQRATWTNLSVPAVPYSQQPWGEPLWSGHAFIFWQTNPWLPGPNNISNPGEKDLTVWAYVP